MRPPLLPLLLALGGPLCAQEAHPPVPGWRAGERWEQRAFIPSERNRHGEVRVLRREDGDCVQTLLYSRMLARGLRAIRSKESAAWPEGQPGHADSTNYLALLRGAENTVRLEFEQRADASDPLQKMLIEFVCLTGRAQVAAYAIDLRDEQGERAITAARLLGLRDVSVDYARRAMQLMTERAFHPAAEGEGGQEAGTGEPAATAPEIEVR